MILLVDNYDSFTYNLYQYLRVLGEDVQVKRNDELSADEVRRLAPRLIVLSPGPGGPQDAGVCSAILDTFHREIPVLGICLGMQVIAAYFGAVVCRAIEPVHGKVRTVEHNGGGLFAGLSNPLRVTRYHSLVVDEASLPEVLEVTARSEEGEVMGIRHKWYPVSGVQFHPEAYLTEEGFELLRNALGARR